jgi:molecular chaperone DnaJ
MDLYLVLGLEREATLDEIKRSYRRLARRFHPDINPGDRVAADQYRRIAEAYETLSDPGRRQRYDSGAGEASIAEASTFGFEGFDFSISVSGASAPTFGDLFADVFRPSEPGRSGVAERGADLQHALALTFDEAMRGGSRELIVTRQEHCRLCHGAGRLQAAQRPCAFCEGSGVVKSARGHMVFSKPCDRCGGAGWQVDTACPACGGRQIEIRSERIVLEVPAGLTDGERIRVAGKGHAGPNGGPCGDLYIVADVEDHPLFRREGDDLHLTVPIAVHEAALGARIEVPSPDGLVRLRVPPGAQSGRQFRIRERGAPSVRDGHRGDLVVEIRLVLPAALDERSKDLMREFGRINSEDVRAHLTTGGPSSDDVSAETPDDSRTRPGGSIPETSAGGGTPEASAGGGTPGAS